MYFDDLVSAATSVFSAIDPITGGIALVIALLGGFVMQRYASIIGVTIGALVIFVAARFAKDVLYDNPGQSIQETFDRWWDGLFAMDFIVVLVWFLAFLVVITVVNILKGVIFRG